MSEGPIKLFIDHVEIFNMEWSMSAEEILGGSGRATLRIQDRLNIYEPKTHWDVEVTIESTGFVLFRGEIINEPMEFIVKHPWRTWVLDCADYNGEMSQRLVGAFDGKTWEDIDGLGDYVNVDPQAHSRKTDKRTVIKILDHYLRVDGEAFDTSEFVFEYLNDFDTLHWAFTDVQAVFEELASHVVENLQFWVDPDLKFHWVAIPAWYDLMQQEALLITDTDQLFSGMFPEGISWLFPKAPADVSDVPGIGSVIGGRDLKFTYDGSNMPEQIYVKGSTGYTYNAPPGKTTTETRRIDPDAEDIDPGDREIFQLTFLQTTRVWDRDDVDGYIILPHVATVVASGPFNVRYKDIPIDPDTGAGGRYWKLLGGPKKGFFVDNDTNDYAWGKIKVTKTVVIKGKPKIGKGGTGWVKEEVQDPNKRQAYLDAPVSSTKARRNAIGGQALYRARRPTLRGSIKVHGTDGWRVGQIFRITDERLPLELNAQLYMIQRVQATLIEGQDIREYVLDFGDGPVSRWSMQPKLKPFDADYDPATQIIVRAFDLSPGPNSTQTITGQLANRAGKPWHVKGRVVKWTLEAYTQQGVRTTGGTVTPEVSITDRNGRARTRLKTGPKRGRVYFVFADVVAK